VDLPVLVVLVEEAEVVLHPSLVDLILVAEVEALVMLVIHHHVEKQAVQE
jgi:hypothetical protein